MAWCDAFDLTPSRSHEKCGLYHGLLDDGLTLKRPLGRSRRRVATAGLIPVPGARVRMDDRVLKRRLMVFRVLADTIVVLHLTFVAFVVLGGLLVTRWPRLAWLHLPAAAWGAWVEFAGTVCPLTPLENRLRAQGGIPIYTSDFIEQYLIPVLYPAWLSPELQWLLGGVVLVVNAVVYASLLRRRLRR
jgi:hypothetical protein